jgi:hypothetical protein
VSRSRIVIRGWAAVFRDDEPVVASEELRTLDGLTYDDERFTDYLGGPEEEDVLAAALESGGILRFGYDGGELLTATTEYLSRRPLTDAEMQLLVDYTMGQWSDGIGENWTCESARRYGFTVMCLTPGDEVGPDYPSVQVTKQ